MTRRSWYKVIWKEQYVCKHQRSGEEISANSQEESKDDSQPQHGPLPHYKQLPTIRTVGDPIDFCRACCEKEEDSQYMFG